MKAGIHPEYKEATIKCGCGNVMKVGSTKENMSVEVCSKCHPFYTGNQKFTVSGGRVEQFKKKYGIKD
jgi:large subunit ribosomal protein L31